MSNSAIRQLSRSQIKGYLWEFFLGVVFPVLGLNALLRMVQDTGESPSIWVAIIFFILMSVITMGVEFNVLEYARSGNIGEISFFKIFTVFNDVRLWLYVKILLLQIAYVTLWSLIPIVGVYFAVKACYEYSQALYLAYDGGYTGARKAMVDSKELMRGHKKEFFLLHLSFIGWMFLVLLTFGLASIYVTPYMYMVNANYYRALKGE